MGKFKNECQIAPSVSHGISTIILFVSQLRENNASGTNGRKKNPAMATAHIGHPDVSNFQFECECDDVLSVPMSAW